MTVEDLIENFEAQKYKTKVEIQELKEKLKDREEYLVKLIGGVEALEILKDQEI